MNPYIELARQAIKYYLKTGKILNTPDNLPAEILKNRAGVFVSIHKKNGDLRGCIGTFLPTKKNSAEELIYNSIAAATEDPRFPAVKTEEFPDLEISVDILNTPKPAKKEDLDPKKYGLIVSSPDGRRGLLLPDIEGVESVEQQIEICKIKAGIATNEPVNFQTFTVVRHQEK